MTRILGALSVLALLAACDEIPVADGGGPVNIAQVDAAIASIGCVMATERHYLPVELQTGLSREQVQRLLQRKLLLNQAVRLPEGGIKLTTGACA